MRQLVRGDQDCFVARDVGLRRERVHALRARRARDRVHAERGDLARGVFLDRLRIPKWREKRQQRLARPHEVELGIRRAGDLGDKLGLSEHLGGVACERGARGFIRFIGK